MKNYTVVEYQDGTRVALPLDTLEQIRGAVALFDAVGQGTMRVHYTPNGVPSLYPTRDGMRVAT